MEVIERPPIDYSGFVTTEQLDPSFVEKKFKHCDSVLSNPKPDVRALARLLKDPTTFSYVHFKDDTGKPMKLRSYQDLIINDSHRFIYFRAANQVGKSLLFNVKAARNLIIDHGYAHNEAIVSKSLPQSTFQMRRVKSLLNTMDKVNWKEEKGSADSMSVITVDIKDDKGKVKYSNMLVCAPCTEGLLGFNLHELNLDEFEYWEVDLKYFFNQVAQPRTYNTKGRIFIMSNPNGQDNFGAELEEQRLLNGERKWHVYVFDYLVNPNNTQEEYDQLKNELSRQEFESTVAAIRSSSSSNYLSPEEVERSRSDSLIPEFIPETEQPFFFLDVGATHDQSCLVGGYISLDEEYDEKKGKEHNKHHIHINIPIIHLYPRGYPLSRVVGSFSEGQDNDGWHYEKSVKDYLDEYSRNGIHPTFGCDVTGNSGLSPLFDTVGINPLDVTFSGPVKSGMYQRLKYVLEKGLLHRIKHKDWEWQAKHLIVTKSARGYLLVNSAGSQAKSKSEDAKLKKTPDDCMDATVGLIHLMNDPEYVPVSLKIF